MDESEALWIIGAGGHGKVVAEIAEIAGFRPISFLDDRFPGHELVGRWPIVGSASDALGSLRFCAVGSNQVRSRMFEELDLWESPTLAHPSAIVSASASLRAGTVVMAGAVVNADAKVGRGCILNTLCSVDHDVEVGEFVHISPGANVAGGVHIGDRAWIGIGASVREGVTIGEDAMVAAGAAVVTDVEARQRVGGVPAKELSARSPSRQRPMEQ